MTNHNATLTLIHDCGPNGDGRYHVSVTTIEGDFDLGTYDELLDAARRMGSWVRHRGLKWASGSMERLAAVHRTDGPVLVLDAVDRIADAAQAWHNVDVYPYVHVAHRMGL